MVTQREGARDLTLKDKIVRRQREDGWRSPAGVERQRWIAERDFKNLSSRAPTKADNVDTLLVIVSRHERVRSSGRRHSSDMPEPAQSATAGRPRPARTRSSVRPPPASTATRGRCRDADRRSGSSGLSENRAAESAGPPPWYPGRSAGRWRWPVAEPFGGLLVSPAKRIILS
jgi:hypothetical protein